MLAGMGGTVIDADQLARDVTAAGQATLPEIRRRFGDAVFAPDGSLDRAAVAEIVFNDAAALRDLEAITHPAVRARVDQQLAAATRDNAPFVVIEAIKLVEGGLADRCDEVWLIDCPPAVQRARLRARGMDPDDADQRITVQGEGLVERLDALLTRTIRRRVIDAAATLDEVGDRVRQALREVVSAG
jgi:dephospho-CoA kinase